MTKTLMAQILKVDKDFVPCPTADGDELYPNGIFVFNITRMLEHIENVTDRMTIVEIAVNDYYWGFSSLNETHLPSVDISRPVIIAEILPGRYNLIDGHHRMEKVRRVGLESVPAYRMNVDQHIRFLTSTKAYTAYIEYWNSKLQ